MTLLSTCFMMHIEEEMKLSFPLDKHIYTFLAHSHAHIYNHTINWLVDKTNNTLVMLSLSLS